MDVLVREKCWWNGSIVLRIAKPATQALFQGLVWSRQRGKLISVHNDHIVEDVAEKLLVQGFAGETWGKLTHEITTRGRSRRLEKGSFAGISMLTLGLPQEIIKLGKLEVQMI